MSEIDFKYNVITDKIIQIYNLVAREYKVKEPKHNQIAVTLQVLYEMRLLNLEACNAILKREVAERYNMFEQQDVDKVLFPLKTENKLFTIEDIDKIEKQAIKSGFGTLEEEYEKVKDIINIEEEKEEENIKVDTRDFVTLSNIDDLFRLKQDEDSYKSDKTRYFSQLKSLANKKYIKHVTQLEIEQIHSLINTMPNFKDIIEYLVAQLKVQQLLGLPFKLPAMLLNGAPGLGKTRFLNKIGEILDIPVYFYNVAQAPDILKLKGLGKQWSTAMPGNFALNLASTDNANVIYVFDEIEKSVKREMHNIQDFLLSILEEETAKKFEDEYLNARIDLSNISFMFTSNTLDFTPAFLTRVEVLEVGELQVEEKIIIIKNIFNELNKKIYKSYFELISEDAINKLLSFDNARVMKREIQKALIKEILEESEVLTDKYIKSNDIKDIYTRIGFL